MIMRHCCVVLMLRCLISLDFVSAGESIHPLSDAKTSQLDKRLIGTWQLKGEDVRLVVKRHPKIKHGFSVEIPLEKAKGFLLCTKIGNKHYLSLADEPVGKQAAGYDFFICKFIDKDTIRVFGADGEVFAKAIAAGKLPGRITTKRVPATPINVQERILRWFLGLPDRDLNSTLERQVETQASTAELRVYVARHTADIFGQKETAVFQRQSGTRKSNAKKERRE